ncbi:prolipoprotein diacylglyceryl transferase, partial [Bordetella hinzii]|nr:prolipoprotein diacylglyceryl transferase [Bordetella hinzii]
MHSVGPFSLPVAAVALAAVLAWLAARLLWREAAGRRAAALLLDALFIGLVAARAAYVLRWWPDYSAAPRAIVSIGDGGFYWWAGLPAGLAWLAWRTRGLPPLRQGGGGGAPRRGGGRGFGARALVPGAGGGPAPRGGGGAGG